MDTRTKHKNYESSILFMQQEHANTLKGLHEEISKLQKKCSELTFHGAMAATYTSQEDVFREKSEALEKEVKSQKKQINSLESEIESKDKRSKFHDDQLKAQEKKYLSELKSKDQTITTLNMELENKASMISTLTMKIREMKKEARGSRETEATRGTREVRSSHARSAGKERQEKSPRSSEGLPIMHLPPKDRTSDTLPSLPAPPKDAPPKQRRVRRSHGDPMLSHTAVRNRPPSSRPLPERPESAGSSDSMPDPTPFLRLASEDDLKPRVRRSERVPLPPIAPKTENPLAILLPTSTDSDKFVRGSTRRTERVSSSSPEVEMLAVDQTKTRKNSLRRAREYNTSSDC